MEEHHCMKLYESLEQFERKYHFNNKGALCVALVVTRHAIKDGLPLEPEMNLTDGGGQVKGLGKGPVQSILAEYGIKRVLAEEGGRTSRGSVGNMRKYVEWLNAIPTQDREHLKKIEQWWVGRVKLFFSAKPFLLRFDPSKSLRSILHDLIGQAMKRQADNIGTTFTGTLLQHLVGAKIDLLLERPIKHHGASVADGVSGRDSDFLVKDVAIHVSTSPNEALIRKCIRNLDAGFRPIIITIGRGAAMAEGHAEAVGIADRIDVFDAEQFIAGNFYELGGFEQKGRRLTAEKLVARYNEILAECETDPSLVIKVSK